MKKLLALGLFALILITQSCKKDSPYEEYVGTWSGTYIGDDTGTWNVTIDDEGKVEGTAISDSVNFPFSATGSITESGAFEAEVPVLFTTIVFSGQLTNDIATGTWVNQIQGINGTWSGTKN